MNYYKFNIGDYAASTAHLSFLEDCAYRRLIDLYYSKEQPIPADIAKACRLVRATSKDERAAVQTVLSEFFTPAEDGWTHGRCDADIAVYQQKAETNRVVGAKGGRPRKQTSQVNSANPEITQTVSENNPQETLTTNHKPRTINQEPVIAEQPAPKARRKQQYPADFYPSETGLAAATAKGIAVHLELEKFRDYHQAKGNTMADWQAAWRTWVGNARTAIRPAESFAERDERNARERFAAFTGSARADVIDITPTQQRITA